MTCPGCGGLVGRDCFNPQECEWIARDQQRRGWEEAERALAEEQEAQYALHLQAEWETAMLEECCAGLA